MTGSFSRNLSCRVVSRLYYNGLRVSLDGFILIPPNELHKILELQFSDQPLNLGTVNRGRTDPCVVGSVYIEYI